ncbi:MAG: hypothetical protein WA615_22940, partial [Bradyrhizobium sp.]
GWGGPALIGAGLGFAGAYGAWGPGWGAGWGPGWGGADPCVRWQQVWTGWGWRVVPVNACW